MKNNLEKGSVWSGPCGSKQGPGAGRDVWDESMQLKTGTNCGTIFAWIFSTISRYPPRVHYSLVFSINNLSSLNFVYHQLP